MEFVRTMKCLHHLVLSKTLQTDGALFFIAFTGLATFILLFLVLEGVDRVYDHFYFLGRWQGLTILVDILVFLFTRFVSVLVLSHLEVIAFLRLPIEIKLGILLIVGLPTIIVVVHPHIRVLLKLGEYVLHIVHYHRKIYIKELSLANRYLLSLILTTTHLLSHIL